MDKVRVLLFQVQHFALTTFPLIVCQILSTFAAVTCIGLLWPGTC